MLNIKNDNEKINYIEDFETFTKRVAELKALINK